MLEWRKGKAVRHDAVKGVVRLASAIKTAPYSARPPVRSLWKESRGEQCHEES
jgi:hypothetical protein